MLAERRLPRLHSVPVNGLSRLDSLRRSFFGEENEKNLSIVTSGRISRFHTKSSLTKEPVTRFILRRTLILTVESVIRIFSVNSQILQYTYVDILF